MKEVWNDPQVKFRNMRVKLKHEKVGETDNIGVIAKFSEKPSSLRTPSPLLGEHSEKILLEHGYSKTEINQFIKNNSMKNTTCESKTNTGKEINYD